MRKLKFRIWDKKYSEYIEEKAHRDFTIYSLPMIPNEYQSDIVIEQYTGLKDRNGKEIYEGDIVASLTKSIEGVNPSFYSYLKGVVKYCEEDTRYYIDGSCERSDREILEKVDLTDVDNFVGNYYELEVIGNVHENPELLKGEK